jgi:ribosomal protein S12 methylthiotransferase
VKAALITLGCDKNTVDSERYAAEITDRGLTLVEDPETADVILVNTCGFIDAAKRESIDALVQAGRLKDEGRCRIVVGLGCMVQRHRDELIEALPEVDIFLGASEMDRLIPELENRGLLDPSSAPVPHPGLRLFSGDAPHIRYLKVSEGCDHGCAFCAIPLMRGLHRSFSLPDVVAEAQLLQAQGAREVNLVAQDLAHWGRDRRDEKLALPDLLRALLRETDIPWIRMLYLYSAGLTPALLELMATEARIAPYLDMPIQHASDTVLARMRRPERQRTIREKLARIRGIVPGIAVRTTCIVGFPGETDADFQTLLGFLEEASFDRLGVFAYSPQEGTRAAALDDDVPASVKRERVERVEELQRSITAESYERRLGRATPAMVDRVRDGELLGRTIWQADDIDGITMIDGAGALVPGTIVDVHLTEVVEDVDLRGTAVGVVSTPQAVPVREQRSLRVLSSVGSFGR